MESTAEYFLSFATHKIRRVEEATKLAKVTVVNSQGKSSLKKTPCLSLIPWEQWGVVLLKGWLNMGVGKYSKTSPASLRKNTSLSKPISKWGKAWFWAKPSTISTVFLLEYKKTNLSKLRKDLSPQQKFQLFPSLLTRETYEAKAAMRILCFIHQQEIPCHIPKWYVALKSITSTCNRSS